MNSDDCTAEDRPADVVDPLLWHDAQYILARHDSGNDCGLCVWCGRSWPCGPRRLAERAADAARVSQPPGSPPPGTARTPTPVQATVVPPVTPALVALPPPIVTVSVVTGPVPTGSSIMAGPGAVALRERPAALLSYAPSGRVAPMVPTERVPSPDARRPRPHPREPVSAS